MKIVAVIPAKNEEKTIGKVVGEIRKYCDFVYVIDDGSVDTTKNNIRFADGVLTNPINLGKGNSLRACVLWLFYQSILKENDVIVFCDSDGQHPLKCIPELIEFMKDNDMVIGQRNMSYYPLRKRFGNWFLSKWCSMLAGKDIKDSESGFRAIRTPLLREILRYSSSRRYAIEMEMNIIAGRLGYNIKFVPVASTYIAGKGVTVKNGILNAIGGLVCYFKMKMNGVT
jgi:glycosyltransferase involved in cell wall biosynthesis